MDKNKFCFIMCGNNEIFVQEALLYISQLKVPNGFCVDTLVVYEAESMTAGYNEAMQASDAKYKIYLHQDVLILNRNLLFDCLKIFEDEEIGMLGVVGNVKLPKDGSPWSDGPGVRIGEVMVDLISEKKYSVFAKISESCRDVAVIDGLFMATQYDLPWRQDLFQGFDMYDCSQSMEFWRAGYRVVVPRMEQPWCFHDNDILNLQNYDRWRKIFVKEYYNDYRRWI